MATELGPLVAVAAGSAVAGLASIGPVAEAATVDSMAVNAPVPSIAPEEMTNTPETGPFIAVVDADSDVSVVEMVASVLESVMELLASRVVSVDGVLTGDAAHPRVPICCTSVESRSPSPFVSITCTHEPMLSPAHSLMTRQQHARLQDAKLTIL